MPHWGSQNEGRARASAHESEKGTIESSPIRVLETRSHEQASRGWCAWVVIPTAVAMQ